MKKFSAIVLTFILLMLCGCGAKSTSTTVNGVNIDLDITEKIFATSVNEIYTNHEKYIDKVVRMEGVYSKNTGIDGDYICIYRNGPGCCANDARYGFLVSCAASKNTYISGNNQFNENDWVEVVGKMKSFDKNGNTYLYIEAISITAKTERGLETITP